MKLLSDFIIGSKFTDSTTFGVDDLNFLELSGRQPFYSQDFDGEGVVIAVIDTGVSPHPEFEDRLLEGYNANRTYNDPKKWQDDDGHGTHVASSIAGKTVGIAPKAKILPIKVLDGGGGLANMNDLIKALQYAYNWKDSKGNRVDIISMSLGGPASAFGGYLDTMHSIIQNCVKSGILVVCAAGNTGSETNHYPGSFEEVVCVSAVDVNKKQAYFTTTGNQVDICQVGVNVIGANYEGGYMALSGTSMSTPIVSGIAALLACRNKKKFKVRMTEPKLYEQLKMNTKDLGIEYADKVYGVGFSCLQPLDVEIKLKIGDPNLYVNGVAVPTDSPPILHNNRFYTSIRTIASQFGWYVSYDAASSTATLKS